MDKNFSPEEFKQYAALTEKIVSSVEELCESYPPTVIALSITTAVTGILAAMKPEGVSNELHAEKCTEFFNLTIAKALELMK